MKETFERSTYTTYVEKMDEERLFNLTTELSDRADIANARDGMYMEAYHEDGAEVMHLVNGLVVSVRICLLTYITDDERRGQPVEADVSLSLGGYDIHA